MTATGPEAKIIQQSTDYRIKLLQLYASVNVCFGKIKKRVKNYLFSLNSVMGKQLSLWKIDIANRVQILVAQLAGGAVGCRIH